MPNRKVALMLTFFVLFILDVEYTYATTAPYTLQQAIELTLRTNPDFSNVAKQNLISKERLKQSKSLYFPSLDLSAETGFEATDTPVINDEDLMRRRISLTMTQLLFDGSSSSNTIRREKSLLEVANYKLFEAGEFTAISVVNSYLNVLRRRELLEIAEKNISAHKEMFKKIKDGVDRGKFNKGDLAQASSRVARAKANFEAVRQSLADAEANYKNVVGVLPPKNMTIPKAMKDYLPEQLPDLIKQAKEINPTISALKTNIKAAEADYKSTYGNNFPTVELQLSGTKGEDVSGIQGTQTLGSALMVMRWNLFKGGADKARIKEAFYQKDIAQNNEATAIRNLERDIRSTWAARKATIRQLKEFEEQVKANKKVVEVYHDQFKLNRRSLLDLLDTQNELFVSKSNRTNVFYSMLFANYRLIALRGDLLKTLKIKIPDPKEITANRKNIKPTMFDKIKVTAISHNNYTTNKAEYIEVVPQKIATAMPNINNNTTAPTNNKKNYFIQLGAYQDNLEAEEMLDIINSKYFNLLNKLTKRIQKANLGAKGIYYRVQVGPLSKSEATKLCDIINSRNTGGCFIVKR